MLGRISYDALNERISIVEEVDLFQKGKSISTNTFYCTKR